MDYKTIHTHSLSNTHFAIEKIAYKNPYDFSKFHRHDYFEILILTEGGGDQSIDFNQIPLKNNSCYVILPKQVHLLKRENSTKGYVIQFDETLIKEKSLLNMLFNLDSPIIFEENPKLINDFLHHVELFNIQKEGEGIYKKEIVRNQVESFVFHLLNYTNSKKAPLKDEYYRLYMNLVEKNFTKWHTVSEYLIHLPISERKLAKITKAHFGETPLQLIHKRIILETKRLLSCDNISIKEISYELGFNYPSNFSQFIKSRTGLTIRQLQKKFIEENSLNF